MTVKDVEIENTFEELEDRLDEGQDLEDALSEMMDIGYNMSVFDGDTQWFYDSEYVEFMRKEFPNKVFI